MPDDEIEFDFAVDDGLLAVAYVEHGLTEREVHPDCPELAQACTRSQNQIEKSFSAGWLRAQGVLHMAETIGLFAIKTVGLSRTKGRKPCTLLEALNPAGEWAISTDGGITHLAPTTLSNWAVEAVGDQIEAFNTKRIRSGVETLLASVRVSSETRGRLQSHGIMGVQARHYDGHDYMAEKLEAVETLYRLLTNTSASVVPLRKKA